MKNDSLAARLLAAFLEDLDEQLGTLGPNLLALEANPSNAGSLQAIFRVAHTLKGAARATDVPYIGEACHLLEERLSTARDESQPLQAQDFRLLFFANDALTDAANRLKGGKTLDGSPMATLLEVLQGEASLPGNTPAGTSGNRFQDARKPHSGSSEGQSASGIIQTDPRQKRRVPDNVSVVESPIRDGDSHIRIAADKVDALISSGSQLLASRSRLSSRTAEVDALHDFATKWASQWRLRGSEVRRMLQYSTLARLVPMLDAFDGNLTRLIQDTGRMARGVANDADALQEMIGTMFERVRDIRMRPFGDVCTPLPRVIRDESAALGKMVNLTITGKDVEADRLVLEAVREALLHLVRNAIDHGIELPEVRQKAGKSPRGHIEVSASIAGERLVVTVSDDGAGIDVQVVKEVLKARGLPVPTDESEVLRSLFIGGVSTRTETTTLSGRGVGLDAVEAATVKMGGEVEVSSMLGRGTTFTLECPLTLATIRALLVSVGDQLIAVPTVSIASLQRIQPQEIGRAEGREIYLTEGKPIPVVSLARVLGPSLAEKRNAGPIALVVLHAREGEIAIVVDRLLNEEEIVVQPIKRMGQMTSLLTGAAILGTGEIAFVVNPPAVIQTGLDSSGDGHSLIAPSQESAVRKRVLVVDDSITTRTLERSTIEAAGYDVTIAVDGADAWRLLQTQPFDLVVSDIEMPRMDGLTLCETIRGSKRTQTIPVILVTALESPAQRMRGLEVGADAYIGKSAFDQQTLTDTIRQLIG